MNSMNPVCLHFHIFKNAGTTIDWILEKNFAKQAIRMDIEKAKQILPMSVVLNYLNKNSNTKSFSSHQIRFPISNDDEFLFLPMIFVRHPIDRAFSIYIFNHRRKDIRSIGIAKAKTMTLPQYIRWNLGLKKTKIMKNFQTYFLANVHENFEVTLEDLKVAEQTIQSCYILGIVDRLDESLVLAEDKLRKYFMNIDMSYIKRNVSTKRKDDLAERLKDGRKEMGDELMNELFANNKFDSSLYKFANGELDKRLKTIHNFSDKLCDFQKRCCQLQESLGDLPHGFKSRRIWYSSAGNWLYHVNSLGKQKILHRF